MIAFAAAIRGPEAYRRFAQPGIERVAEADSEIYAFAAVEPQGRAYNLILDAAAERDDLEALVLVHPHVEITDPRFCEKVREALARPDVDLVGCAGATGVRSIAWWHGDVVASTLTHRYDDFGGGRFPAYSWTDRRVAPADVEALDGRLLVLSPWAVRNVRFDETLLLNDGFDLDYSLQVRAAGRRLMVADLEATYHLTIELVPELDVWIEAHIDVAEKWDEMLHGPTDGEDAWKRRVRLAEADRESARALAFSRSLMLMARTEQLERELEEKTHSRSWRLTAPLRTINRARREAAERRNGAGPAEG